MAVVLLFAHLAMASRSFRSPNVTEPTLETRLLALAELPQFYYPSTIPAKSGFQLVKNNLLGTVTLPEDYVIRFELMITVATDDFVHTYGLRNIIHLCHQFGFRPKTGSRCAQCRHSGHNRSPHQGYRCQEQVPQLH